MTCFFKDLTSWKDPSLSAAFLTAGNLVVLVSMFAADPFAWVQFFIVYGLLPLGLVARLGGLDKPILSACTRNSHVHLGGCDALNLMKIGIYCMFASRIVDWIGLPLLVGLVGNCVLLGPIVCKEFPARRLRSWVEEGRYLGIEKIHQGIEFIYNLHVLAASVFGGVFACVCVFVLSVLIDSLIVNALAVIGYLLILCFGLFPQIGGWLVAQLQPRISTVDMSLVWDVILWENYSVSISVFVCMYAFYLVSSFVGAWTLVAVLTGSGVAVWLMPMAVKEKWALLLDRQVLRVRKFVQELFDKFSKSAEATSLAAQSTGLEATVNVLVAAPQAAPLEASLPHAEAHETVEAPSAAHETVEAPSAAPTTSHAETPESDSPVPEVESNSGPGASPDVNANRPTSPIYFDE